MNTKIKSVNKEEIIANVKEFLFKLIKKERKKQFRIFVDVRLYDLLSDQVLYSLCEPYFNLAGHRILLNVDYDLEDYQIKFETTDLFNAAS
jgi:hypothetical protein